MRIKEGMHQDDIARLGWVKDNSKYIAGLYDKYAVDLIRVRKEQVNTYNNIVGYPMFDDVEAELLYMLVRERKPDRVVELGSCTFWSTTWLMWGLHDNAHGHLFTYDLAPGPLDNIPDVLRQAVGQRFDFTTVQGDALKQDIPDGIDMLLQDAAHELPWAQDFMDYALPKVNTGGLIMIHDVFALATPAHGEAIAAYKYLDENNMKCWTPSSTYPKSWAAIQKARMDNDITWNIHTSEVNSLMLFENP
jgi:predicted O-methyltransferase YrrM